MSYKIDRNVLAAVAEEVAAQRLAGGELIARTTDLLAAAYPDLIDPTPGRWVGSKAGGILGKVRRRSSSSRVRSIPTTLNPTTWPR
jgi:sigma non-opioid intracellular receptor